MIDPENIKEEHPMYRAFVEIAALMGDVVHHPDNDGFERLEEMDVLARVIYQTHFPNKRTREEFALFIAILMTIYHKQFIDMEHNENVTKKKTKNAPTLVKRNPKGC